MRASSTPSAGATASQQQAQRPQLVGDDGGFFGRGGHEREAQTADLVPEQVERFFDEDGVGGQEQRPVERAEAFVEPLRRGLVAGSDEPGHLGELHRLRELSDLGIYAGNDDMLLDVLKMGGLGGICVASHLVGPQLAEMARLVRAGDLAAAEKLDEGLRDLYKTLFLTANPILVKEALNLLGHEVGGLRLPLVPATPDESAVVADELRRLGVLTEA